MNPFGHSRCSRPFLVQGIDAELVSLENIIDWDVLGEEGEGAGGKAADGPPQLGQAFYSRLSQRLGQRLAECGDRVPVVTGACLRSPTLCSPRLAGGH